MNRLLVTDGNGTFSESEYQCPEVSPMDIRVRSVLCGVCRSDIDMMQGDFATLPHYMSGHEGLGQVTRLGADVKNLAIGDYVATRGEPAYADYYNVRHQEYIKVPEALPRYILEPVACGINLVNQSIKSWPVDYNTIMIVGSGFLAMAAFLTIKQHLSKQPDITVVGSHNADLWASHGVTLQPYLDDHKKFDVVIDLSSSDEVFTTRCFYPGGVLVLGAKKKPSSNITFEMQLWDSITIILPSPRFNQFHYSMKAALTLVSTYPKEFDHFWSIGYDRDTEWKQAFIDGANRPERYSRGYLKW